MVIRFWMTILLFLILCSPISLQSCICCLDPIFQAFFIDVFVQKVFNTDGVIRSGTFFRQGILKDKVNGPEGDVGLVKLGFHKEHNSGRFFKGKNIGIHINDQGSCLLTKLPGIIDVIENKVLVKKGVFRDPYIGIFQCLFRLDFQMSISDAVLIGEGWTVENLVCQLPIFLIYPLSCYETTGYRIISIEEHLSNHVNIQ